MVLTFLFALLNQSIWSQEDIIVCWDLFCFFARISKADQDCVLRLPMTATCDQAYPVSTVKRNHVISRIFGIFEAFLF